MTRLSRKRMVLRVFPNHRGLKKVLQRLNFSDMIDIKRVFFSINQ